MEEEKADSPSDRKRREWRLFLFIIVLLFPLLSVAVVGTYGFSIWMYQLIMGPPGPPG
jgi:periplasmic nitrate reductase NapE